MASWFFNFASYKKPNDIFNAIKSGKKTIETRPYNPKKEKNYSKIKEGDTLIFKSRVTGEKLQKVATFVHLYKSVKDMTQNEDATTILPGVNNPNELIEIYEQLKKKWGSSYARNLEANGIVAIGFK